MGFEPMIRVLQTLALPLGHVAFCECGCILRERKRNVNLGMVKFEGFFIWPEKSPYPVLLRISMKWIQLL